MSAGQLDRVIEHVRRLAGSPETAGESDRQLLSRFVHDHDQDAFSALVNRHGSMVLGVCRRVLGNDHDAQDAFQGTFLVLARKAAVLRWRESISNWLHSVAYRLALQVRDGVSRQRAIERRLALSAQAKESSCDASLPELCAALDEELNRLPNRYRAALICCYLKGQTRDHAAAECGWSLRTLDRRLHRGREILRARLVRRGMTLPAVLLVAGLSGHGARAGVPGALASSTARAAVTFGIRGAVPSGISATAITTAERALGLFTVFKLKLIAALSVAFALAALGAGALGFQSLSAENPKIDSIQELNSEAPNKTQAIAAQKKATALPAEDDKLPQGAVARFGNNRLKPIGNIMNLAYSPDGTKLASWSDETYITSALCIWNSKSGELLRRTDIPGAEVLGLEWMQDGRIIGLIDTGHGEPLVWDFNQETLVPTVEPLRKMGFRSVLRVPPGPAETCYALSPDGQTLAVGLSEKDSSSGEIVLRQLKTGVGTRGLFTQRQLSLQPGVPELLFYTPDGKRVVAFNKPEKINEKQKAAKQLIVVWEVAKGKEICRFTAQCPADYGANRPPVAVSNRELAIGLDDGGTSLWDLASGTQRRIATAHSGRKPSGKYGTLAIAFFPDGKSFVTGGGDGLVKVWETVSGKHVRTLPRNYSGVEALTEAPDNRTIAAGYYPVNLRLTGRPCEA